MAWPSDSPRARFVRIWRWRLQKLRAEFQAWIEHALELDRAQRDAVHDKVRAFLGLPERE